MNQITRENNYKLIKMKKLTLLAVFILFVTAMAQLQTIPISQARLLPIGTIVTIEGVIINDASLMGWTWYIQNETAGIAGYSTTFSTVGALPGDKVKVTGTLKNYNSLLEISPVTEVVIVSSNNPIPAPTALVVPQILAVGETYESMLVKVSNVHFSPSLQGTLFNAAASGYNYWIFNQAGDSMQMRVLPLTNINGTLIPMGNINMIGCLGQYSPSNPASGYQLIPRSLDDITSTSSIVLTAPVTVSDITNSSVTLSWTTDNPGSTAVKYGITPSLELGTVNGTGNTTDHSATIPGAAAQILYAKVYSISSSVATDTAKSTTAAYITASNSSGTVKAYFNTPVDNSVSSGTNAISIGQAIDDTLVAYINRSKQSIDIAIYSFDNEGLSNISNALNSADNRGVDVRIVYCGTTVNAGVDELNASIHKLMGPTVANRDGIMHNKFMIIDANSSNANDPLVWTGSANWTADNINTDANNVIIIQDQSLARTYQAEFEEMWGSNTLTANAAKAKFGSAKTNNTPHQLKIGGKWADCYFSPSDNVNAEIISRIGTTESDLECATMLVTRKEIAYAVADAVDAGATASFLVSSFSDEVVPANPPNYPNPDSTVFLSLKNHCAMFGDYNGGGIMHNKYMIVDQSNPTSDPMVWTGSHNWSGGANTSNDENSICIHDATLANIYYQNFVKIMSMADVLYGIDDLQGYTPGDVTIYPNPASNYLNVDVKANNTVEYRIELLDLSGRILRSNSKKAAAGLNHSELELNGLNSGLYLIRISSRNGSYVQKLVVR